MSDCIVIAVLNGIEISHKLFTPEMVTDARSIRGCESVLGMSLCRLIPVQFWTKCKATALIETQCVTTTLNCHSNVSLSVMVCSGCRRDSITTRPAACCDRRCQQRAEMCQVGPCAVRARPRAVFRHSQTKHFPLQQFCLTVRLVCRFMA